MDKKNTIHIIQTLANGIDPTTGEVFPNDSPYHNVDIVRALFHASKLLEQVKELPDKAGKPWSDEEQQNVINDFNNGRSIAEIARQYQRTSGAIRSRLQKVGVITN